VNKNSETGKNGRPWAAWANRGVQDGEANKWYFKQENRCITMNKLKTRYMKGTAYPVKGKQRK
jgi:hypothetical protein